MKDFRIAAAVFAVCLCLAGCKDEAKREECKQFSDWNNKAAMAMQSTVPDSERTGAKTPTVEGLEKNRPKMEALQLEDGKVNQERSAIMADWLRICSQK